MQSIPAAVVPTVHTEASLNQPPHLLRTARASCGSNTGHRVSVALCEVHVLLYKRAGSIIPAFVCTALYLGYHKVHLAVSTIKLASYLSPVTIACLSPLALLWKTSQAFTELYKHFLLNTPHKSYSLYFKKCVFTTSASQPGMASHASLFNDVTPQHPVACCHTVGVVQMSSRVSVSVSFPEPENLRFIISYISNSSVRRDAKTKIQHIEENKLINGFSWSYCEVRVR